MAGIIAGDAKRVTPPQSSGTIASITRQARLPGKVRMMLLYCPDGTDPGIPANTDTVFVGPNKAASFPLAPGGSLPFWNVNPWDVGVYCATANQLLFYAFGGDDE